jgi:hypothetical protein
MPEALHAFHCRILKGLRSAYHYLLRDIPPATMESDLPPPFVEVLGSGVAIILPQITTPFASLTYVQDRLYLASYTSPPGPETYFPYPEQKTHRRSPSKRSSRAVDGPVPIVSENQAPPCYFSIDDSLLYNAFHHDFGPLHIGHLYRFAVQFHDILGAPENKGRPVVFWSKADPRSKLKNVLIPEVILAYIPQVEQMRHAFWHVIWF